MWQVAVSALLNLEGTDLRFWLWAVYVQRMNIIYLTRLKRQIAFLVEGHRRRASNRDDKLRECLQFPTTLYLSTASDHVTDVVKLRGNKDCTILIHEGYIYDFGNICTNFLPSDMTKTSMSTWTKLGLHVINTDRDRVDCSHT